MKQIFILLLVSFALISCNNQTVKIDNELDASAEIDSLMTKWHNDAAEANLEAYLGLMHENAVYIGTDGHENWTKSEFAEFCKPYFENNQTWNFSTLERNIYTSENNNFAYFDEVLKTGLGPCRGSGVLELINNKWYLKHYVLSMIVSNYDIDNVLNAKSINDSIYIRSF